MHEIEIFKADDKNITSLVAALSEKGIEVQEIDGHRIFVEPMEIGPAVEIINAAGFETDEDQYEIEDEIDAD